MSQWLARPHVSGARCAGDGAMPAGAIPLGPPTRNHRGALALAGLSLALLVLIALRPLTLPDEGRYVGIAWEMVRSGNWLVPTIDGLPFLQKPPLFYWITAIALELFGVNPFAARVAPLLGAALGAAALFWFTRRWNGERPARLATTALLAQPLFLGGAQFANLDMLVAGLITATILLSAHVVLTAESGHVDARARLAACGMAALGVLAKGLIGVVIPALVLAAWAIASGRGRALRALVAWRASLLFVVLAVPWFVAVQVRLPAFFDYFFLVQHLDRFASAGFNNVAPAWFFPLVLLVLCAPWLPWLYRQLSQWPPDARRDPVRSLMLAWLIVVVVFFSIPASKLVGYVLPATAPLAWLIADGFARSGRASTRGRRRWWAAASAGCAAGLGVALVLTLVPRASSRALADEVRTRRVASEPLLMLGRYDFDLPLYARMHEPIGVVDDWSSPDVRRHDNWRRELAEAARFDPDLAATRLIDRRSLPERLCRSPVTWVVGAAGSEATLPILLHAQTITSRNGVSLWRFDAAAVAPFCRAGETTALRSERVGMRRATGARTATGLSGPSR
jgi:Dolichyl-phosphate-mannose-protein mannosyltransferase